MSKRSIEPQNTVCPQATFLVGTYREDGTPNFGLFCWATYCWDGGLGMVVSMGGSKLTRDRIAASSVFSANLVTERLLPLADYFGNTDGHDPHKMDVEFSWQPGVVLPVPVLSDSPWTFELEVKRAMEQDDGVVFLCAVRNVLADESLLDESLDMGEKVAITKPVLCMPDAYFSVGARLGHWGQWKNYREEHEKAVD